MPMSDEVFGTCNTCGGDITRRQTDERHADEVWCGKCGIRFSLSNPDHVARHVDGKRTWSWRRTWRPSSPELKERIKFILNGVECYLTFADLEYGTPQGWARPDYLLASGYVLASEAKADKLQALKDIAFRLRQHTAALFMDCDEDGNSFRSLLIEIDAEIAKVEKP